MRQVSWHVLFHAIRNFAREFDDVFCHQNARSSVCAYTRPLASWQGQTFSSWHKSDVDFQREGRLSQMQLCPGKRVPPCPNILPTSPQCVRCHGMYFSMQSEILHVNSMVYFATKMPEAVYVPILGLWPVDKAKRFPHGTRVMWISKGRAGCHKCNYALGRESHHVPTFYPQVRNASFVRVLFYSWSAVINISQMFFSYSKLLPIFFSYHCARTCLK